MKYGLTLLLLLVICGTSDAQLKPCGTQAYKDPWLTEFQQRLDQLDILDSQDDTVLYVPIKLHILGEDDGTGYYPLSRALTALCVLNDDFVQANMHFYLLGDVNYIDNSNWFSHSDIITGAEMMFANNVDAAINCYIMQDAAGNCGYNLPYAGVALSKSCAGPNDHTWAHEIGHNLSLPHPFLGWEGGQTHDNTNPPQFNSPAPEYVTYDYTLFKSVFYPDTLIIDTALVEKVDRSNCREAADGFCDTECDYLARRWNCNGSGISTQVQTDPNGETFQSEGKWIMSYANDACSSDFSDEQVMAMRANLREQKPELLANQNGFLAMSTESPTLISPLDEEETDILNTVLTWLPLEGATDYIVEVSRLRNFAFLEFTALVQDTFSQVQNVQADRTYYWRIKPYNAYQFCANYSSSGTFVPKDITSTSDIPGIEHLTFPGTSEFRISLQTNRPLDLSVEVWSVSGTRLFESAWNVAEGSNLFSANWDFDATGVYFVRLLTKDYQEIFKISR